MQNTKWKEAGGLPKQSKEAFEAIKAAISSRPVMAYPNNNGRFHLYVDAALGDSKDEGGLGAACGKRTTRNQTGHRIQIRKTDRIGEKLPRVCHRNASGSLRIDVLPALLGNKEVHIVHRSQTTQ
jgi:hypothetical protein